MTRDAAAIETWLVAALARELGTPAVDATTAFPDLGLGSRQAVLLAGDLEDWLGREVDAALMWEHPNARALAAHLAG